jgi:hypothetical protein
MMPASLVMANDYTEVSRPDVLPPEDNIKRVVVASPRATLVTTVIPGDTNQPPVRPVDVIALIDEDKVSVDDTEFLPPDGTAPDRALTVGGAANFAKDGDSIRVKRYRTVLVQLSPEAEGVWYDHAIGWLGAKITVYARYWGMVVPDNMTDEQEDTPWRFVGRDGAAAITIGPAIGRASRPIGVPIDFGRAGAYEILARIITYAYPVTSVNDPITRPPTLDELRMNAVVAHDDVRLKVFVNPRGALLEVDPVPHSDLDMIDPMPVETLPGILE